MDPLSGTTYTAPANGWVSIDKAVVGATGQGVWVALYNSQNEWLGGFSIVSYSEGSSLAGTVPVRRGMVFKVGYNATGVLKAFRFIYAQGSYND